MSVVLIPSILDAVNRQGYTIYKNSFLSNIFLSCSTFLYCNKLKSIWNDKIETYRDLCFVFVIFVILKDIIWWNKFQERNVSCCFTASLLLLRLRSTALPTVQFLKTYTFVVVVVDPYVILQLTIQSLWFYNLSDCNFVN